MGYALEQLGSARCKEIAATLFTVEKDYAGRSVLHGFCPIHGDKASSSFAYNYAGDWYKCQSCGAGGDLVKLWCELHGLDAHGDGFIQFKKEFVEDSAPGAPRRQKPKAPEGDVVDRSGWRQQRLPEVLVPEGDLAALPPLPADAVEQLGKARGWTPATIAALDLRQYKDSRGNQRIAIPIRTADGGLGNIRLYQPGAAQFKMISWYDHKCKACGGAWKKVKNEKVCKECGAAPNDYGRSRLFPPPSAWKQGTLWLCEGEPDTICALSMGLNAATQTAGCGTWPDEFSEELEGRDVVICYDADQAGHKGALKAAESIAHHAKSVRVIVWPELMGEPRG